MISIPTSFGVRTTDDRALSFGAEYRDSRVTLKNMGELTWSRPDPDHVVLEGTYMGSPVTIRLSRVDMNKFLLLNRGFHWISEMPFNR
jgi:hypothetical protein